MAAIYAHANFSHERKRQINELGYHPDLDVGNSDKLLAAAACYARAAKWLEGGENPQAVVNAPVSWPWAARYWKSDSPQRMREKAGALTMAALQAQNAEYAKYDPTATSEEI